MAEHIRIEIRRMRGYDEMESREERIDLPEGATSEMLREAFIMVEIGLATLRELVDTTVEEVAAQVEAAEAEAESVEEAS